MRSAITVLPVVVLLALVGCVPSVVAGDTPEAKPTVSSVPPATPSPSATQAPTPTPSGPVFVAVDPALFFVPGEEWSGPNFISPSSNIGCAIGFYDTFDWGCRIGEMNWEFSSSDPSDYCYDSQVGCGQGIEARADGLPHPRQRSDPGFPGAFPTYEGDNSYYGIKTLEYGQSITWGDVTCYSEESAMRCENAVSGHGFILSRDRNDIF